MTGGVVEGIDADAVSAGASTTGAGLAIGAGFDASGELLAGAVAAAACENAGGNIFLVSDSTGCESASLASSANSSSSPAGGSAPGGNKLRCGCTPGCGSRLSNAGVAR
ncbi:MAG: hypothetical protein VX257_05995, partial [Planctomycetota bacterium]|nr:hypothetical protein [Planctomycetota bacterium]